MAPDSNPRTLYLDLMVKTLANTIYGDANQAKWGKKIFDFALRSQGMDWPSVAHTMVGTARLQNLRELTERAVELGIPGDVIETGVWRGGCCILMQAVLKAMGATDRRVYVCDSFKGLPPPRPGLYPADKGDKHHTFKELAVSAETVRGNFEKYGLLDENIVFVEGFFHETLHKIPAERYALLRLDGDMYESTDIALKALYPKLSPGGFIIIDDYGAVPACRQAVDDYRKAQGIAEEIHKADWTGVWWQKSA